jgi:autotransporter-associated beta strand protein
MIDQSGSGKLTLNATSTYTGPTTVRAGTLEFGSSAALSGTQSFVLHPAAALDVSAQAGFALTAARPVTVKLDGTGSGTSGRIQAAALDITAASVVFDIAAPLDDPVYLLATYTSKTGSAFATVTPPPGYALNYAYNGNPGSSDLAILPDLGHLRSEFRLHLHPPRVIRR